MLLTLLTALASPPPAAAQVGQKRAAQHNAAAEKPNFKLVGIRRIAGPWIVLYKSLDGTQLRLDDKSPVPAQATSATRPPIAQNASEITDAYAALDAFAPGTAAVVLISLEDAVDRSHLYWTALRELEKALGHQPNALRIAMPTTPGPSAWYRSSSESLTIDSDGYVLSFLTTEAELADKLKSTDVAERRLAINAFRMIRAPLAVPHLLVGVTDSDDKIRAAALQEIEQRRPQAITVLRAHPAGGAAPDGALKELLVRLEYTAALVAKSVKDYESFLARYPLSRYEPEMRYRLLEARGDTAGMRRYRATFPDKGEVQDIVDAVREGWVELAVSGGGIQNVQVRLRRVVANPIRLRVPAASYFVAGDLASQNMVTTKEQLIDLVSEDWQSFGIPAACAELPKKVPDGGDTFAVQRAPPQAELPRLIGLMETARVGFAVRQAAVWIITNDASYADLGKLVSRSLQTRVATRAIQEDDVAMAMKLVEAAGVDLTQLAIWRDRSAVTAGTTDAKLRNWLAVHP